MGEMKDFFQQRGKVPLDRDKLNKYSNGLARV